MKTLRSAPLALIALLVALATLGAACSSGTSPALTVDGWSVSTSDFQDQLDSFAAVYESANGTATDLYEEDGKTYSTTFTSAFLNDQMNLQLAQMGVEERGLEVTSADTDQAKATLEKSFVNQSDGSSVFDQLDESYQQVLIAGVAAQSVLGRALVADSATDEGLRKLFDASPEQFAGDQACVSHILILAGSNPGQGTPTDEEYAAALTKIQGVESQLQGTSNFAELAQANSDDGSATSGGDLGCAPKGSFVAEFDDAVWSQPVGEVGPPVKTSYGYHLILVRKRGPVTFDDVKDQLAASLQANAESLLTTELARLAKDADISVNGRYGRFDPETGQITAPEGAQDPSTTSTAVESAPAAEATP